MDAAGVSVVDEELGDRAGAAVEVLVGAPGRPIDPGVVQGERDVPGGMGQVPERDGARLVDRGGEAWDVVDLARGVVHAGEQGHGEPVTVLVDGALEVLDPVQRLAVPRPDDDQVARGIEPVQAQLQFDGIPVGRERRCVDEDRRPRAGRPEERREQQVQVDGQRVERRDLVGTRPDEPRGRFAHGVVGLEPGAVPGEPAVDPEPPPRLELGVDGGAGRHGLGAERLTREVDARRAVVGGGQHESVAVAGKGIARVEPARVVLGPIDGWRRQRPTGSGAAFAPGQSGAPPLAISRTSTPAASRRLAAMLARAPDLHITVTGPSRGIEASWSARSPRGIRIAPGTTPSSRHSCGSRTSRA